MKISAVFADGSKLQVDGWTYAPTTPLTTNDTEITISYMAFGQTWTVKQGITVKAFSPVLNENTWAQISSASQSGQAASLWSVGDAKEITLSGAVQSVNVSGHKTWVYILGFNHNAEKEGDNLIHFGCFRDGKEYTTQNSVALVDGYYTSVISGNTFCMNRSATNSGGWKESNMRKTVINADAPTPSESGNFSFLSTLPNDLKTVMRQCTKYTENTSGMSTPPLAQNVTATKDWAFLLSEFEVSGKVEYSSQYEQDHQKQYEYYRLGNSKIKYIYNDLNQPCIWWLRSLNIRLHDYFCRVSITGETNATDISTTSLGFAPAFCV